MNLFISWSGERSEIVARGLHQWIKCVIQAVNPFFSPKDISGGSVWIAALNDNLASSNAGIICLTPENQFEPWIQFEAGALAKGLSENRIFILLIGMDTLEVKGPLSSWNHTPSTKEGIEKMVFDLNNLLGEKKLSSEILKKVFDKNFIDFDELLIDTIKMTPKGKKQSLEKDGIDIQNEMLELLRGLSKRVSKIEEATKFQIDYNTRIYRASNDNIIETKTNFNEYQKGVIGAHRPVKDKYFSFNIPENERDLGLDDSSIKSAG